MNDQTEFPLVPGTEPVKVKQRKPKDESHLFNISVRGFIALLIVITVCIMGLRKIEVEEPLYSLSIAAVSFYMGQNIKTRPPATTVLLLLLCVALLFSSTGCASYGTITKNLSEDGAIVKMKVGTPWGVQDVLRIGDTTNSVIVMPDGTIFIN